MKKYFILSLILFLTIKVNGDDTLSAILKIKDVFDGPYISIINDTTFKAQYIKGGTIDEREFSGKKKVKFIGFADDKLNKFIISSKFSTPNFKTDNASKIFVFSDIHGEYEFLCELLKNNKIVNSKLHWAFGDGHLVVDGDVFDRGDKVTEILWMLYRLEQEADKAGGKVHFLLGNHEIMPLQDDLRYINEKYELVAEVLDPDSSYMNLFNNQTVLGRWLRSKNVCEVINDILFVHAGISPRMKRNKYSLEFINETVRANIDTPYKKIKADSTLKNLFGSFGPLWYRGYHYDMEKYKQATAKQVDSLLTYYNVSNIIVGHTTMDSTAVLYNGKVFGINQDYEIKDEIEGLYIENGVFHACDIKGVRRQVFVNE